MVSNKHIAKRLKLLSQLMELHNENPFKIKSLQNASFKISKSPEPLANKSLDQIASFDGIGDSTAKKIKDIIDTDTSPELEKLINTTPQGIVAMLHIKGLGAKKILSIWHDLGIDDIGELYYACIENRLVEAKGFGLKTQEEIKKNIEFLETSAGKYLYARLQELCADIEEKIGKEWKAQGFDFSETGQLRRKCEIIEQIEYLVSTDSLDNWLNFLRLKDLFSSIEKNENSVTAILPESDLAITFHTCEKDLFATKLFETTASPTHLQHIKAKIDLSKAFASEEEIYAQAQLPYIIPELREGLHEFDLFQQNPDIQLIEKKQLKGSLHNHSTWSDGQNSLEEMALYCRDILQLEYFGICDHSQSAFYANGLKPERVAAQHQEIDKLNQKLAPFKIFKGIESDILNDGSLDYPEEVLASFDFVVASVHSNLKMDEEKAMARLLKAIENPYTTILGHPTGRLLLSRQGYPIDYKKIIDACAANQVIIEINANPLRLDLDWRWHQYAAEKGVLLSINPDAHNLAGLHDMLYGVLAARKGGLSAANIFNTLDQNTVEQYFKK